MIYPWIRTEGIDYVMVVLALYLLGEFVVTGYWLALVCGMICAKIAAHVVGRSIMDLWPAAGEEFKQSLWRQILKHEGKL